MKKFTKILGICILLAALVWLGSVVADRRYLNEHVIRLHVVANSDSREDQQLKLQVRDAVTAWLADAADPQMTARQAAVWLSDQLPRLERVAKDAAAAAGWQGEVSVSFGKEAFPIREYETFTLPAGVYQSLRIGIGESQGKNWWCVVFPSLCLPATSEDFRDTAAGAGFSDSLSGALSDGRTYEVRFFLLDWLGRLENFLFRK